MYSRPGSVSDTISHAAPGYRRLVTIVLVSLAIIASLIASAVIGYRSVFAIGPEAAGDCLPDCSTADITSTPVSWDGPAQPGLSPNVISPMDPAIGGNIESFGSVAPQPQPQPEGADQTRSVYVWAAFLCVSEYSDAESTYLGYMPELLPTEGGLNPASFSYLDTNRRVEGLYYQETDTDNRRLVLELDEPLEIDLTLFAGNMAFPFAASTTSELGPNARVWMLDSSLGWTPGQPVLVVLGENFDMPMSQAGQEEISHSQVGIFCDNSSETVWTANLVVGEASNSSTTYLGYLPSMSPPEGQLDITTFTYDGVEYSIRSLFYQEVGQARQLVLSTDQQLPDELVLEIGGMEYPVADSLKMGTDGNIHGWRLESDLGWTEDQRLEVSLLIPRR